MKLSYGVSKSWGEILGPTWRLIDFDRRELGILLVYTFALGIITATVPFVSQILVNQAAFTGTAPPIIVLSLVVLGVMLIGTMIRLFQISVSALIAKRTFVRTAINGSAALLRSPPGTYEFDDREIANRFFDVMIFQTRFSIIVSEGLGVIVYSFLGTALLAFYHPLFLAFALLLVLLCLAIIIPFAKSGIARAYARSSEKYKVAYWLSQLAEHRSLLSQARDNKLILSRTDALAGQYVRTYFDYLRLLLTQSGALFLVQAIGSAAFFGLGGWLVTRGELNLGQLVAAEIVLLAIMGTLGRFNYYLDSFYEMAVAAQKVGELTEAGRKEEVRPLLSNVIQGLTIKSPLLAEPLQLKCGDIVALRGKRRRDCSRLLRGMVSEHPERVEVVWDSEHHFDRSSGTQLMLYLARPTVLRMPLAENLALLSGETSLEAARESVLDVPMLTAEEMANADVPLTDVDISISDRARYASARAFMTPRPVVLIDVFFNLMELDDQVELVSEFKRRFPERILIINAFDTAIDPFVTKVVTLKGDDSQ